MFLGSQSKSRITSITARAPGAGLLGGLQTTYTSFDDGPFSSKTTPIYGADSGPTVTWNLNGEGITGVRGRHNGKSISELRFVTSLGESSPAFGQALGDLDFSINAPKTSEGRDTVLYSMTGNSDGAVNSMVFVWAEPVELPPPSSGLIMVSWSGPDRESDPRATYYDLYVPLHWTCVLDLNCPSLPAYDSLHAPTIHDLPPTLDNHFLPNSVKPRLHALIIGIDKYKSNAHLTAAVQDALNFKQYLTNDLLVPGTQIRVLLDEQASRSGILWAIRDLASGDNEIKTNDAIIIYYAGYGSELDYPDRALNDPLVRCIIPQDLSISDGIFPISGFTIGALVHMIAQQKGNNITLIFDCSYSACGCGDEILPGVRSVDKKDLPLLPVLPDRSMVQDALSGSDVVDPFSPGLSFQAVDTHILLAACGLREAAFENREQNYGYFSKALLAVLRSVEVNSLTYRGLMQRIPALTTSQTQGPVCEGKHVDRILFNAQVQGANASFIVIEPKSDGVYLQAGLVKGITPDSKFAVHAGDVFGPYDTIIGEVEVDRVDPFAARIKDGSNLRTLCYARQVGYGADQALGIHVTKEFVEAAEPSEIWSRSFSGREGELVLRPASLDLAQVILSVTKQNETIFTLKNPVSVKHRIEMLPLSGKKPIPPSAPHVTPILCALAKWNWYLRRAPAPRPFQNFVDMEFYRLQSTGGYTDNGRLILDVEGENLALGGEADILANAEDLYGIRVSNRSSVDLYLYMLSFSLTTLAIESKPIATIGSSSQGLLLPKSQLITIGYGSSGQAPFVFSLDDAQYLDATILRLFVSTHPADFEGVEQESPFEDSGASPDNRVKDIFGKEAAWDVVDVNIVYRRWPKRDPTIIEMFPASGITPVMDSGIIPVLGEVTAPRDTDTQLTPMPLVVIGPSTTNDTALAPYSGLDSGRALFTGRSSAPLHVQARTPAATFKSWFRTPVLTPELLASIQCMRLRTLANEKGPSETSSDAETGGYFEIWVIAPDGLPKLSANEKEMIYHSHSASKSSEWADGTIFEEDHEVWGNLEEGDCFEVSVCAKGRGWVCEAEAGNLIFW
ncbi:unnamed protein product [Rhizoctonia solani]|uniref:Peptidase C14 caspase domain-containing protein n=1 Tax=Rhizoctonia solani TaxID=456999 RepID=A0A8H3DJD6_9AGAM|nr:unnamed protein product [Rhizoctonia solani]